jgi:hypothetical protein
MLEAGDKDDGTGGEGFSDRRGSDRMHRRAVVVVAAGPLSSK